MTYKALLRHKPWLHVVNINNITSRLQKNTKGNAFVVFNNIQQAYELHTIEAYNLSGDSYNATLDRELLSQFLISDYQAKNFAVNLDDFVSDKELMEHLHDKHEENRRKVTLEESLKVIERTMGTHI